MKKLVIFLFAFLLLAGVASAASIPGAVDPKAGPEVWITSVYNNASADLAVGDVVVWDVASSTGDNDNYITTTTTADTYLVAGIVYPAAISDGDSGSIAIKGIVSCDVLTGVTEGDLLCTSTTAGESATCTTEAAAYGYAAAAGVDTTVQCVIF